MTTGRINQVTRQTDTRENTGEVLQENDHPRPGASRFSKRLSETRFASQPTNFNCPLTSHLRSGESGSREAETKWTQQMRRDGSNLQTAVRRRVTVHAGVAPHPGAVCNNSLRRNPSEPNTKSPQRVGYPSLAKQLTDQQTTLFSSHRPADTN